MLADVNKEKKREGKRTYKRGHLFSYNSIICRQLHINKLLGFKQYTLRIKISHYWSKDQKRTENERQKQIQWNL